MFLKARYLQGITNGFSITHRGKFAVLSEFILTRSNIVEILPLHNTFFCRPIHCFLHPDLWFGMADH